VEERSGLEGQCGVGVLAEGRRSRPHSGGVQQAHVSYRAGLRGSNETEEVVEVEVLDVARTVPRRWSTSPHLSVDRAELASTRAA
jgi:hypothetical protein